MVNQAGERHAICSIGMTAVLSTSLSPCLSTCRPPPPPPFLPSLRAPTSSLRLSAALSWFWGSLRPSSGRLLGGAVARRPARGLAQDVRASASHCGAGIGCGKPRAALQLSLAARDSALPRWAPSPLHDAAPLADRKSRSPPHNLQAAATNSRRLPPSAGGRLHVALACPSPLLAAGLLPCSPSTP